MHVYESLTGTDLINDNLGEKMSLDTPSPWHIEVSRKDKRREFSEMLHERPPSPFKKQIWTLDRSIH
jgi:hypothetical protein